MSNMIRCDGCKYTMYDDSRSEKDDYHEVWIDRCYQYHLCRRCYQLFMEDVLRRVWDEDDMEWVEKEG